MADDGLLIQAQRIPIGTFRSPQGKEIPVTITLEWYKVLVQLAGQVAAGTGGSTDEGDDEGIDPGGHLGAILARVATGGDSSGPEAGAFAGALLFAALGRVQALEADPGVSGLSAKIAALSERVAALEQGNGT